MHNGNKCIDQRTMPLSRGFAETLFDHKRFKGWFALSLIFVLLGDIPNTIGPGFILVHMTLLMTLFIGALFLPLRPALLMITAMALTGQDIVSSAYTEFSSYATASIWQTRLLGISPSIFPFIALLIQFFKVKRIQLPLYSTTIILFFLTVPILMSVVYQNYISTSFALSEIVTDVKFPLFLLVSTIVFFSAIKSDRSFNLQLLLVVFSSILARHLIDFIYYFLNIGPVITEGVSRASVDSAKGSIILVLFYGISLAVIHGRKLASVSLIVFSLILLIAYGTRMLWVTAAMGALYIVVLVKMKRFLVILFSGILIFSISLLALNAINPDSATVTLARFKTITHGRNSNNIRLKVGGDHISRVDPARAAEIINIIYQVGRKYSVFWGLGYGGYYTSEPVYFPEDMKSAFPERFFRSGKFYTAHGFLQLVVLKYGVIGLVLVLLFWCKPFFTMAKRYRFKKVWHEEEKIILGVVFALAPFVFTSVLVFYWSAKTLFFSGLLIASVSCLSDSLLNERAI